MSIEFQLKVIELEKDVKNLEVKVFDLERHLETCVQMISNLVNAKDSNAGKQKKVS